MKSTFLPRMVMVFLATMCSLEF